MQKKNSSQDSHDHETQTPSLNIKQRNRSAFELEMASRMYDELFGELEGLVARVELLKKDERDQTANKRNGNLTYISLLAVIILQNFIILFMLAT